ncbi:MAG: hypothetical protein M1826_001139 [Phylliscum demangeonii]|nr:MAG: hypothetical protein M1826_001139 [Phylliscum demangeonii]
MRNPKRGREGKGKRPKKGLPKRRGRGGGAGAGAGAATGANGVEVVAKFKAKPDLLPLPTQAPTTITPPKPVAVSQQRNVTTSAVVNGRDTNRNVVGEKGRARKRKRTADDAVDEEKDKESGDGRLESERKGLVNGAGARADAGVESGEASGPREQEVERQAAPNRRKRKKPVIGDEQGETSEKLKVTRKKAEGDMSENDMKEEGNGKGGRKRRRRTDPTRAGLNDGADGQQVAANGVQPDQLDIPTATTTNGSVEIGTHSKKAAGAEDPAPSKKSSRPQANESSHGVVNGSKSHDANHRYIVFVGNLPYSATTDSIRTHFASVHPTSVRHLTHKEDPSKSKGQAFLEFDGHGNMETCLRKFHHSRFAADGNEPGRKINVELTAGGGGSKSSARQQKLKDKNEKLSEERKQSHLRQSGGGGGMQDSVHPSRRGRVGGV